MKIKNSNRKSHLNNDIEYRYKNKKIPQLYYNFFIYINNYKLQLEGSIEKLNHIHVMWKA